MKNFNFKKALPVIISIALYYFDKIAE